MCHEGWMFIPKPTRMLVLVDVVRNAKPLVSFPMMIHSKGLPLTCCPLALALVHLPLPAQPPARAFHIPMAGRIVQVPIRHGN